jgi:hypothetical protein
MVGLVLCVVQTQPLQGDDMATKKKPEKAKASSPKKGKKPDWKEEAKAVADTITDPGLRRLAHQGIETLAEEDEGADVSAKALLEEQDKLLVTPDQALTLPLLTDSGTLFIQGVQHLNAQLLGQPESARLLVRVNEWMDALAKVKKLIVGNDDAIEGLKKLVIEQGQPWGEKGSKQLTLAGVVVKVKAVNARNPEATPTIDDLDPAKVEAYLRGVPWDQPIEKVLGCYMKPVTTWTLKDLPPQQQKNLQAMLADPGMDGQGLRQCLKDTKFQMMQPELENA